MTLTALYNKLSRHGLNVERIQLQNVAGVAGIRDALRVCHNYIGPYPTRDALTAYETAASIARKAGFTAQQRGHYTATYIF